MQKQSIQFITYPDRLSDVLPGASFRGMGVSGPPRFCDSFFHVNLNCVLVLHEIWSVDSQENH